MADAHSTDGQAPGRYTTGLITPEPCDGLFLKYFRTIITNYLQVNINIGHNKNIINIPLVVVNIPHILRIEVG